MGQIALSLPQTNLPNATEDPKIVNDLTLIQNVINGNLDASNLSTTSGIMKLGVTVAASNYAANYGDLVNANGVGITVTLPAPRNNAMVCVWNSGGSGASPTVVSGTNIYGAGLSAATSFKLGALGAVAVLQSDGASWLMTAGQQDTGWVPLTIGTSWSQSGGTYTPAYRVLGDRVWLRGGVLNGTGGTSTAPFGTFPAASRPASLVQLPVGVSNANASTMLLNTSGVSLLEVGVANGQAIYVDNVSYPLV